MIQNKCNNQIHKIHKSVLQTSYDIMKKGHEEELKVETKEGEETSFIIILPTKNTA